MSCFCCVCSGCYGFWCCPCLACSTTGEFGESPCLPLVDFIGPAFAVAFGVPVCVPPASLAMRVAIRHKYKIKGNLCWDILASCFCIWCSWCQMAREVKEHNKGCVYTNVQPMALQGQPSVITIENNMSCVVNQPASETHPYTVYLRDGIKKKNPGNHIV
uniref:Plac8 onzin related protein 10 n=1 Tax=Esox lucius TaxID=8010 RepID=A0A3P8YAN3_ESOLU